MKDLTGKVIDLLDESSLEAVKVLAVNIVDNTKFLEILRLKKLLERYY